MFKIITIGIGGFLGSISRYLISGFVQNMSRNISFPYGTFAVNSIGCLIIGIVSQLGETKGFLSDLSRSFIIIGFLGGFTTFSAFGNETFNLLHDGETNLAVLNALGQVIICLTCVWAGRGIAYWLWR
ncbi:MAG: fluoride efflux transporter CrcB [Nitrospirae bacterium]|nr:fluoride efflux transporter CrcB [Nitrospirota bacterium]